MTERVAGTQIVIRDKRAHRLVGHESERRVLARSETFTTPRRLV